MRLVIVESPFAAPASTPEDEAPAIVARNLRYLRACMRDCLLRGEAPYASHGLYTQPGVLDDGKPDERKHGIDAGFEWRHVADATVFYTDLGWSNGMTYGKGAAERLRHVKQHDVIERSLGPTWERDTFAREEAFSTRWPMFGVAEFPCGWDQPRTTNVAPDGENSRMVVWQGSLLTPDEAEGLAFGLVTAARAARKVGG